MTNSTKNTIKATAETKASNPLEAAQASTKTAMREALTNALAWANANDGEVQTLTGEVALTTLAYIEAVSTNVKVEQEKHLTRKAITDYAYKLAGYMGNTIAEPQNKSFEDMVSRGVNRAILAHSTDGYQVATEASEVPYKYAPKKNNGVMQIKRGDLITEAKNILPEVPVALAEGGTQNVTNEDETMIPASIRHQEFAYSKHCGTTRAAQQTGTAKNPAAAWNPDDNSTVGRCKAFSALAESLLGVQSGKPISPLDLDEEQRKAISRALYHAEQLTKAGYANFKTLSETLDEDNAATDEAATIANRKKMADVKAKAA